MKNYRKSGYVSVWVGNFTDEDEFDDYLLDHFGEDFGIDIEPAKIGEIGAESSPVDIRTLVDGFSRSATFEDKCVEAASKKGIEQASCMFVAYDYEYPESQQKNPNAQLTFIGALGYPGYQ